jgi:homocysteine S-methyltransferase
MYNPLLERLEKGPILCDGGMGSLIFARGVPYQQCYEELNVTQPDFIQQIHRDYIAAGAEIIETNTFGGNRYRLARHNLENRVREFNLKGAKIAKEARDISGEIVMVAGSIGPLGQVSGSGGGLTSEQIQEAFCEQIEALMEGGVDLLIFETFYDFIEMKLALEIARKLTNMPIVAQMTFIEDGTTFSGNTPAQVVQMLIDGGADVVGVNCHIGPQGTLSVLGQMVTSAPEFHNFSAQPNAGAPIRAEGRMLYQATPEYFARLVPEFLGLGVKILGGCCGTTPEHIAAMRHAIDSLLPEQVKKFAPGSSGEYIFSPPHHDPGPDNQEQTAGGALQRTLDKSTNCEPTELARKLASKEFVVSVELLPPKGINPTRMLQAASRMAELGADVVNITDSAMAKVRMGSMTCAILIKQSVGIETIIHYTSRDRNLMALQSDLLGAHANGIRNVLALTGDPPRLGDYPGASGIWDVDSIGLVSMMNRFNQGADWNGTSIGTPANFNIGCAFEPTAHDLEVHIERLRKKIEAGAHFIMTQPVFDVEILRETLGRLGNIKLPIIAGIMLLHNYKLAEYIHNEVPGIVIPKSVLERMRDAGDKASLEGLKIAAELIEQMGSMVQGVYLMPHGKYDASAELVRMLKG